MRSKCNAAPAAKVRRRPRLERLAKRQLMAGDVDFIQSADITGVYFEVDGEQHFADEAGMPALAVEEGQNIRVTGIRYDVAADAPTEDGVIAFEVYRRREHGALEIGSYDYTDGRYGDPVENSLARGQSYVHPGIESGWDLDAIDNRVAVVAIRYVGDQWNIEDRFYIDVAPQTPEALAGWAASIQTSDEAVTIETNRVTGESSPQNVSDDDGYFVATVAAADEASQRYEITVDASTSENGDYANGFVVLDYESEDDFIYVGLRAHADRWVIGQFDGNFHDVAALAEPIELDQSYDLRVAVDGSHVALAVDGVFKVSHDFDRDLSDGSAGLANQRAFTTFENFDFFENSHTLVEEETATDAADDAAEESDIDADAERQAEEQQRLREAFDRQTAALQSAVDQASSELLRAESEYSATLEHFDSLSARLQQAEAAYDQAKQREKDLKKASKDVRAEAKAARKAADEYRKQLREELRDAEGDSAAAQALLGKAHQDYEQAVKALDDHFETGFDPNLGFATPSEDAHDDGDEPSDDPSIVPEIVDMDDLIKEDSCIAYSLNFNHQDRGAFEAVVGRTETVAGQMHLLPGESSLAIAVLDDEVLPERTETRMYATVHADKVGNLYQNGFIIFDYQSPDDFKYAGAWAGADRWAIGHYQDGQFNDLKTLAQDIAEGPAYELQIWIEGADVTFLVTGEEKLSHTFDAPVDGGSLAVGGYHSQPRFDQVAVMQLYGGRQAGQPLDLDVVDDALSELF